MDTGPAREVVGRPHPERRAERAETRLDLPLPQREDSGTRTREDLPLPEFPLELKLPKAEIPTSRTSGQWSVPWEQQEQGAHAPQAAQAQAQTQAQAPAEEKRRGKRWLVGVLVAVLLVAAVAAGQWFRPVPDPELRMALAARTHTFAGTAPVLPWSGQGQAAVYVDGLGTMGSSGGAAPTPTASVAKVMTAYVYLKQHPLRSGEAGADRTVSAQGVAELPARKQRGESLLGITAGQHLTERKALEALLLISANDVAHELARWDSGTDAAFVAKMNEAARGLGMASTTYTDPSGYDAGTVSTAADQVKLLTAAMKIPAFAEVVKNRAYVPDGGGEARPAGNLLLGQYGVVGGKTGYTDKAGGNYVFAAKRRVGGVPTMIVGAVMGQHSPSAVGAMSVGRRLLVAAERALTAETVAPAGAVVAKVDDGLGGTTPLVTRSALNVVGWPGLTVNLGVAGDPPATAAAGTAVGQVDVGAAKVPLVLRGALDAPSPVQRLTRLS
ncbi:D-alanyl-D-alanine carboxypeptidase family protein [Actinomadura parmotrematis]|uniref:D-alanyl-D-alanine carboxypeptidase n=1 Tax=Actinomadura parmotrematis TaxID=2864039 RepID=A0ABS7FWL0_9ACTN|nr:D-alanyl-D-alanine carboxypeptidase [Actinomadura parmotrematis]MBW8483972.1 D-alanyl-D-alanine carboxypeptidase [Actinomadura parmotrematis]